MNFSYNKPFMNSFDLLFALKNKGYLTKLRDPLWWPRSGSYEVIVGAILTQQTKWEKVEKSLECLRQNGIDSLEKIASLELESLSSFIKPSGFYNTKAKYLKELSGAILRDFGSFEIFCLEVERTWLLSQKGVGEESADSILCYACHQEAMVVDAYTARLLLGFGYEFDSYEALQTWTVTGIAENRKKLNLLYEKEIGLNEIYARFHGKIVEFCKENSSGKAVHVKDLGLCC